MKIIQIIGVSGAGKSTLTEKIRNHFSYMYVEQFPPKDDFFHSNETVKNIYFESISSGNLDKVRLLDQEQINLLEQFKKDKNYDLLIMSPHYKIYFGESKNIWLRASLDSHTITQRIINRVGEENKILNSLRDLEYSLFVQSFNERSENDFIYDNDSDFNALIEYINAN